MSKQVAMLATAIVLAVPTMGAGQSLSSGVHVEAGYQVLHLPDETFPIGLAATVSGRDTGLTWAGQIGWARDDQNEPGVGGALTFIDYGAGPRWTVVRPKARLYGQFIAGGVHTAADLTQNGVPFKDSDSAFMLQPGAGVVVPVRPQWGIFGQADYRRVFFKEESENEFRFVVGVRIGNR